MAYGSALVDTITTSGNLSITGNVATSGSFQPSALKGLSTTAPPLLQNSAGTEIGRVAKAWVIVTSASTTPTIASAFNISACTLVSTGVWDLTVINPTPGSGATVTGFFTSDGNYNITMAIIAGSITTTNIRISCKTGSGAAYSTGTLYAGFFW